MNPLLSSITKNAIGLSLFAFFTAGVVAITQHSTSAQIDHNIRLAQAKALNQIVPTGSYDNDILNDKIDLSGLDTSLLGAVKAPFAQVARSNGHIHTVLIPAIAPDGYTQEIALLVGINEDGSLAGVRITEHRETPGLGDKIDIKKSDWVNTFQGRSLINTSNENWAVKKDNGSFDQFTGATITPRAVVKAVHKALLFSQQHHELLFNNASSQGE